MNDKPAKPDKSRKEVEAELDEALDETFPASDPVSPVQPHKNETEKESPNGTARR